MTGRRKTATLFIGGWFSLNKAHANLATPLHANNVPDQDDMYGWTPDPQPPRRPAAESSGGTGVGCQKHYREDAVDSILTGGSRGTGGGPAHKRRPTAHIMASPLFSAPPAMCAPGLAQSNYRLVW